jgi:glycosyltransferase involved in cell wall biosynthesis
MKIIHVISNLGNAGAEKFVVELSNVQSAEHQVSIITFRNIDDSMYPPKKLSKNVKLYELGKKKGFDISIIFKLIRIFIKEPPDIINTHLDSVIRYVYVASLFCRKPKYVQTLHSRLENEKARLFKQLKVLPGFRSRFNNVCISESIYRDFCNTYKGFQFHHIDNGLAQLEKTEKYEEVRNEIIQYKQEGKSVFVAIGRFTYHKNFQMLASVFCQLKNEGKNVQLLIIGGDKARQADDINEVLEIKCDNTALLGPKENIADYLLSADAFVLSSRSEGMPIVILEALSAGLPIVSTPAGGVVDMIKNNENGFISESIEQESFNRSIQDYFNADTKLLDQIRKNNKAKFRQSYSIESCSEKYVKLYTSLLQ